MKPLKLLHHSLFLKMPLAVGLGLLTLLGGCSLSKTYMSSTLTVSASSDTAYRIAILPFDSQNPYLSGASFSDFFTVRIHQRISGFQVIERKDMMKILQEQKLTLSGLVRMDKFYKLGSMLGVNAVLMGSVQTLETLQGDGGAITVVVKLIEVPTGKILWADRQKITYNTWIAKEVPEIADILMEKTAEKIVSKMAQMSEQVLSANELSEDSKATVQALLNRP